MNLNGIVAPYTAAITPQIIAQLLASSGSSTAPDGSRTPLYADPVDIPISVQALQYMDLVKLDGLNIQGERRAVYLSGDWNGIVRADQKGGDLLKFQEYPGAPVRTWLAAMVLESWADWTKLAVTEQVG